MKTAFFVMCGSTLVVAAFACGSSDDSKAGGGGVSGLDCLDGSVLTPACMTYTTCTKTSCATQVAAAFGPSFATSGTATGDCAAYYSCIYAADCADPPGVCAQVATPACRQDLAAAESCVQTSCAAQATACNASLSALAGGGGSAP